MKKVIAKLGLLFIASTILISCGGGNSKPTDKDFEAYKPKFSSTEITTKDKNIKGELSKYLTILSESVKVSYLGIETGLGGSMNGNKQQWELKLKVERTAEDLEWDIEKLNGNYTKLSLTILDESGAPISGLDKVNCKSGHDLVDDILTLNGGENGWVTFIIKKGQYQDEDIVKEWSSFEVNSSVGFVTKYIDEDTENESEEDLVESGDNNFDEMLDDYEEYVDEYIKFYKKAMEGDNNAITQYTALMQKASALQQSMAKAQNNNKLNASQIQRMMKIQTKMATAALKMQN